MLILWLVLLQPVVSVGNVGQLAADLIISTLWMDRIGYIMHEAITPAVGNNPFAHADADSTACKLTTCCEGEHLYLFLFFC
jgi:proteasome assembly chaperone 2